MSKVKYEKCIHYKEDEKILTCPRYGYCIVKANLVSECEDYVNRN